VKNINTPSTAADKAGSSCFLLLSFSQCGSLDDSHDEGLKLMVNHKLSSRYYENISYASDRKEILSGIQGVADSKQVMAIMEAIIIIYYYSSITMYAVEDYDTA
jgi:hypothetical protein